MCFFYMSHVPAKDTFLLLPALMDNKDFKPSFSRKQTAFFIEE